MSKHEPKSKLIARNDNSEAVQVIEIGGDPREFVKMIALGILHGGMHILERYRQRDRSQLPAPNEAGASSEIMTADEVAAFLGVDRNTIYEYAGRGVIPHRRLGKRMIFRRETLNAWLGAAATTGTAKP